ncbi:MAG: amino acid ABC transporter ATP-binding protein [Erysipelotrichaceae bacterium]|nr:amino acid ABC transporter ATP-binding protein [Erysipelotrichaceae bacterium]
MAYLEVRNLKKKFSNDLEALKGISFDVDKNEIMAVIGPSGSGKTTMLRCLNFLETADEGSITINNETIYDGKTLSENEIRKNRLHFGLVFQSFNLFPQYNAVENISLSMDLKNPDKKKENREKTLYLLSEVGLSDKKDSYPFELSGGQQQRLAIARALALDPDILCFDEPTSALDPALVGSVVKLIKNLKESGRTILIVTHDMSFAKRTADRILYMSEGELVEINTAEEFFNNPQNEKTKEFLKELEL